MLCITQTKRYYMENIIVQQTKDHICTVIKSISGDHKWMLREVGDKKRVHGNNTKHTHI